MTYVMTNLETLDTEAIPIYIEDEPTLRYDFTVTQELPAIDLALLCVECRSDSQAPQS